MLEEMFPKCFGGGPFFAVLAGGPGGQSYLREHYGSSLTDAICQPILWHARRAEPAGPEPAKPAVPLSRSTPSAPTHS